MRVKRLLASMMITSLTLATTLGTVWAADEAVPPPPVAGAPSELAPTPTPTT